jgi:excinuclease UvrABC nuclease subunit
MNLPIPETIDVELLPSLPLQKRLLLPNIAAVYFVLSNTTEVLYVGRSQSLCFRWQSHGLFYELEAIESVKIAWIPVDTEANLISLEASCIAYFQPPYNKFPRKTRTEAATYQTVTLRFPKEMLASCRERAARERRSLNAELVLMIERCLEKSPHNKQDLPDPVYS